MLHPAIPTLLVLALAAPASAAARVVTVDRVDHDTTDDVTVHVQPNRPAPRGWHYLLTLYTENDDEQEAGCAHLGTEPTYYGRRPFRVTFTPGAAEGALDGADFWCEGRAKALLYIQRNGSPKLIRLRAQSRWIYFNDSF